MTTTNDPHVKLLRKAFGDLDARPFAWCFDEEQPLTEPAAALEEPREDETYECTLDVLFYLVTNGQMGTRPLPSLRRYEPPQK